MPDNTCDLRPTTNWFDRGGAAYAQFRPTYPEQLAAFLASVVPSRELAVDAGCGNGQLTQKLAGHFASVVGVDPSAEQIANATPDPRIRYACAPAEALPLAAASAGLLTAAQAAHWFDLPAFYAEARRVLVPGGVLALISYGVPRLEAGLDERFARFYWQEIGPWWPAERQLVDSGYATLDFPFAEFPGPAIDIRLAWTLDELLGYLSTWSAVRRAREAGREDILRAFADELAAAWGERATRRAVVWPINMRLGKT